MTINVAINDTTITIDIIHIVYVIPVDSLLYVDNRLFNLSTLSCDSNVWRVSLSTAFESFSILTLDLKSCA